MKYPSFRVSGFANLLTNTKRIRHKYWKNLGGDSFSAIFLRKLQTEIWVFLLKINMFLPLNWSFMRFLAINFRKDTKVT